MTSVVYIADRRMPSFQAARLSVDVVCAGDSITGWNNFGCREGLAVPHVPGVPPAALRAPRSDRRQRRHRRGGQPERARSGPGLPGLVPERPVLRGRLRHQRPRDVARGRADQPPDHREPRPDGAGDPGRREAADPPQRAVCERVDVPPKGCRGSAPHEGLPQRAADSTTAWRTTSRSSISPRSSGTSISPTSCIPNDEGAQVIATEVFRVLSEVRQTEGLE